MPPQLEAGSEWRRRNIVSRSKRGASPEPATLEPADEQQPLAPAPAQALSPTEQEVINLAERPEEIIEGEESCRDALKAARSSRRFAQSRIVACHQNGDEAMAQRWVQILNQLLGRQQLLEQGFRDILERDKKTMTASAAKRAYEGVFHDLRQKLLAAPAALAAQLNPNDPLHAQGILENWVRLLFKGIYENDKATT